MYPHLNEHDSEPWENDDPMNLSSSMDCTGLIPAKTNSEQEEENYSELYDFLPNAVTRDDNSRQ